MNRTFVSSEGVNADALQKNSTYLLDDYILQNKSIPIRVFGESIPLAIPEAISWLTTNGGGRVSIPADSTHFALEINVHKDRNGEYHTNFEYYYDRFPTVEARPYTDEAWQVGDVIYNDQPNIDKCMGWVCTAAGIPGTWTPFGYTKKWFSEVETVDALPNPNELQLGRQLLLRESNGSTVLYYCIQNGETYKWERAFNLPPVDATLTQSGSAADAKVVGAKLAQEFTDRKAEIEVERSRINNLVANNNDTEGNSELVDIRTAADGTVHESAGAAVRSQINDVKKDISSGNVGDFSIRDRKLARSVATRNLYDYYDNEIIQLGFNSSLIASPGERYRTAIIPVATPGNYAFKFMITGLEDSSQLASVQVLAFSEKPEASLAGVSRGTVGHRGDHVRGWIAVDDSITYLAIQLSLNIGLLSDLSTAAEKSPILDQWAATLLSELELELVDTDYSSTDYDSMQFTKPYLLLVEEEDLSSEVRTKLNKTVSESDLSPEVQAKLNKEIEAAAIQAKSVAVLSTTSNLITEDIVSLGAGWSGTLSEGLLHTSGNAESITLDINSSDGDKYLVEFDTSYTAGPCTSVGIGDSYQTDTYNGNTHVILVCKSVNGGSLYITPVSTFSGTLSNISCKLITTDGTETTELELYNIAKSDVIDELYGYWNVVIGDDSLKCVNSTRSIAIGINSLRLCEGGNRNIAIGTFSMSQMINGEGNIAIGADSMLGVTSAHDSISIGKGAMYSGIHEYDVAVGPYALQGDSSTDTSKNVGVGYQAGFYNQGKTNTFVGAQSGYQNRTGYNNVGIGSQALRTNKTGNNNTVVGAGSNVPDGTSNTTVVGAGATATGDNQVVLGNANVTTLIFGNKLISFNEDGTVTWSTIT